MKILITGAKGQLGQQFRVASAGDRDNRYIFTDVDELDITDSRAVASMIVAEKPGVVINCAGYTAVDQAENEPEKAMLINATAVEILAKAVNETETLLLHISTDYVFDGSSSVPYTEESPANPVSVYARSKYEGEQAVWCHANRGIIMRTSWLYSAFGHNFIKTLLTYGAERESLRVVADQVGTPTYARDLCHAIIEILPALGEHWGVELFHYSNEGVASWYDVACSIAEFGRLGCRVVPIESKDYLQLATRPFYSVLNKSHFKNRFGIAIPYWRDSLMDCILEIRQGEHGRAGGTVRG